MHAAADAVVDMANPVPNVAALSADTAAHLMAPNMAAHSVAPVVPLMAPNVVVSVAVSVVPGAKTIP